MMETSQKKMTYHELIKIAYVNPWKCLHPALQHTIVADLVLSNQFDALVGSDELGQVVPLAAKHWEISKDFKSVVFKIDNSKSFPDKKALTSKDFKKSWEDALRLDPKSNNNSLLDVLYKISGFEEFKKTGEISGIQTPDDETLILTFSTPFRMILDHLQGNRFSAYRQISEGFAGTGKYKIKEIADDELLLSKSDSGSDTPVFKVLSLAGQKAFEAVKENEIDIVSYAFGSSVPEDLGKYPFISKLIGHEAIHLAFQLNSLPGHVLADEELRRGLQYLIHSHLKSQPALIGNPEFTSLDPQIYLPMQAGRISESEVNSLIEADRYLGQKLIEESKKRPLVVWSVNHTKLQEALIEIGLTLSGKSGLVPIDKYFEISNKSSEFDVLISVFSVANGDPDGIYHKLGKFGAIRGQAILARDTSCELEVGREIVDPDRLHEHYQKVTRTFLREVPLVHLGFGKNVTLYRNDRVRINSTVLRMNQGHLHIFESTLDC